MDEGKSHLPLIAARRSTMSEPTVSTTSRQLLRCFLIADLRPLSALLDAEPILAVLAEELGKTLDRIFTPVVTLVMFLGQILDADHSCQTAVERLAAARVAAGQKPCSTDTG